MNRSVPLSQRKVLPAIPRFAGFLIVLAAGGETPNKVGFSLLESACRVFGFRFEDNHDIDAEVKRAMKGDFGPDKDCAIRENRI